MHADKHVTSISRRQNAVEMSRHATYMNLVPSQSLILEAEPNIEPTNSTLSWKEQEDSQNDFSLHLHQW
jgi:hypothetical protein